MIEIDIKFEEVAIANAFFNKHLRRIQNTIINVYIYSYKI